MRGAWVKRPRSRFRYRRLRASGRQPYEPRSSRGLERQRLRALALISEGRAEIHALADLYNVSADAIAGAILWDAVENPYRRPFLRLGPGKVHPCEVGRKSAAERAEEAGLVPFIPSGAVSRLRILRRPEGAFAYIAAILAYHAANYEAIAGVDIRTDSAVLCTLYQGGASEARAARFARRRSRDPNSTPRPADEMGPWVETQRTFIRALLTQPSQIRAGAPTPTVSPAFAFARRSPASRVAGMGQEQHRETAGQTERHGATGARVSVAVSSNLMAGPSADSPPGAAEATLGFKVGRFARRK